MNQWTSHGDILRWWRTDVSNLSQRELGDRVGIGRTAVSNWEKGTRMASVEIDRLDSALEADGVLAGLLWAFGTPEGIEPNRIWTYVYPGESTPVWVWIRHPGDSLHIRAEWGIYGIDHEFESGPNGLFIKLGGSIPDSPLLYEMSSPCWSDFGRGRLPEAVAGAPITDAMEVMQPSSDQGDFASLLSSTIVERFEHEPLQEIATLPQQAQRSMETFLGQVDGSGHGSPQGARPELRDGIEALDRSNFARMRSARRMSYPDVRQRLLDQTGIRVGKDTLRRFEAGTGEPHDPLLAVALDHVLGGNGRLVLAELGTGHGSGAVTVPEYWTAPVWVSFEGEQEEFVAELHWAGWRRRIEGRLPMLVINHSAMAPLRILAEPSVKWTVGVGRRNGATPINQGWLPTSMDTSNQALNTYQAALMDAVRSANLENGQR